MKKKIITLFLILLFILTSLLSACNSKTATDTEQTSQTQTESLLPDAGKFVVVVPSTGSNDYTAGNEAVKQKIISPYMIVYYVLVIMESTQSSTQAC